MLELGIPEIRRKKKKSVCSLFPLCSLIWPSLFLLLRKNCFQANPFYLQFCSAAELLAVGVSRVIYLYRKCGRALCNSHSVGTFMNE